MVFLYFPFAADSNNTEFSFLFNSTFSFNSLLFATHPQESRPFKPLLGCLNKKYYLFFFLLQLQEKKRTEMQKYSGGRQDSGPKGVLY